MTAETLAAKLTKYAQSTASDMGTDYVAAVRAMDDEPAEVAQSISCTVQDVQAWIDAELAQRAPQTAARERSAPTW